MSLIGLLVALVVICLLWWAITRIMAAFGLGDPIATIVKVVFVVAVVLWLLSAFGFVSPIRLR
jgi:type IV secretory pathway TrbL component